MLSSEFPKYSKCLKPDANAQETWVVNWPLLGGESGSGYIYNDTSNELSELPYKYEGLNFLNTWVTPPMQPYSYYKYEWTRTPSQVDFDGGEIATERIIPDDLKEGGTEKVSRTDVTVKIDLVKPTGSIGFGVPLLLSTVPEEGDGTAVSYTKCSSLEDVVTAGFADTTLTYKTAELIFMQDDPPAEIAVASTEDTAAEYISSVYNADLDFRQVILADGLISSTTDIESLATAAETRGNVVVFVSSSSGTTGTVVSQADHDRIFMFYGDLADNGGLPVGALIGATAGYTPGEITYKNIKLKGVKSVWEGKTSKERISLIDAANGCYAIEKAGDIVTSEGKVLSGEYLDIIDCQDWIIQQITYRTQKLLNAMPKVPYDNVGIAMLENECTTVLKEAANAGMIAYDTDAGSHLYSTDYALRQDTTAEDRAVRKYIGGRFSFELAGAIHTVEITGEIIV